MIPAVLTSLVSGAAVTGGGRKEIIYPFSGPSGRFFELSSGVSPRPYRAVEDLPAFRVQLFSAALSLRAYLMEHHHEILETVARETGSPVIWQREDLEGACLFLANVSRLEKLFSKKYLFDPKGNILLVLSANEPIIVATILVFSALFTGNTVFVKPSSKTPSFAFVLIRKLATFAALRERVHCLLSDREETERLMKMRAFDFVLSLGSSATNKQLLLRCADVDVDFVPESEGNDWCYVDRDCGAIKKIGRIIAESFTKHNGQMCNAVRGVLVHTDRFDALSAEIKKNVSSFTVGSPDNMVFHLGALLEGTSSPARALVEQAVEGAEEVWNYSLKGNCMTPTLILNPNARASIIRETVFAPVLWIQRVRDHAEAMTFYNEHNVHGLGFSVFSYDRKVAADFIHHIRVGRVNINRHPLKTGLFEPLGGILLSGRGGPSHWVEKMSNRKFVTQYFPRSSS